LYGKSPFGVKVSAVKSTIFITKSGNMNNRRLYLIPSTLGDSEINRVIPDFNHKVIHELRHFVVEEERTARRFLIKCGLRNFDDIQFYILNEHTSPAEIPAIFSDSVNADLGLLSEAGLPGVADPGAMLVAEAHHLQMRIVPLSGPSSLMLALMASGLNGQQFAFNGYLPVKPPERAAKIKFLEKKSASENQSQLFIEAPYRNNQLLESLLANLQGSTHLCIAMNLTMDEEWISTKTVSEWKQIPPPDLKKKPAVFIFQA
jgi:16S rRNA (cytidine1402-2'-O)-methyltransferase